MLFSVVYYLLLILFLIVFAVFISVVWLLTVWWEPKRRIIARTTYWHAAGVFVLCPRWRVKIEGKEHLEKGKNYVIVSNHQAFYDIPLLHMLKFNARWVAKRELLRFPFVGHAMLIHGDILLKRGDAASAKAMFTKAKRELERGVSIVIFPEGTRTKTGRMGRFKEGAFLLARQTGAEILPVVIEGTGSAFRDGWKPLCPHTFRIRVLPAIDRETVRNTSPREMAVRVHDRILEEHRKMRPDLYDGTEDAGTVREKDDAERRK